MFNLDDLMEMFEGNENRDNQRRGPARENRGGAFAFGRDDDDDHDEEGHDRHNRAQSRRRREDDDEGPLSGLFG